MKRRYSKVEKELQRKGQLGICPGCLRPLPEDSDGHTPFPSNHDSWLAGVELCRECHKKTPTYGTGEPGLYKYFFDDSTYVLF